MTDGSRGERRDAPFVFPRWANLLRPALAVLLIGGPAYLLTLAYYGGNPRTLATGYAPQQPVPYSHALHAGKLGMDCRYCHNTVERAAFAALPPTQTCMNCHAQIWTNAELLAPVRNSFASGRPLVWTRVNRLPDFVHFNHSIHIAKGIGCVSCHGRVDKMNLMYQAQPLTMSWCINCHRNPEKYVRPKEKVFDIAYEVPDQAVIGPKLVKQYNIRSYTHCSTCHY